MSKVGSNPSPSTDEWIGKMWQKCTMKYSVLKRKLVLIHATAQMSLGDIRPSEIVETQNDRYCLITLT